MSANIPCQDPRICGVQNHRPGTVCKAASRRPTPQGDSTPGLAQTPPSARTAAEDTSVDPDDVRGLVREIDPEGEWDFSWEERSSRSRKPRSATLARSDSDGGYSHILRLELNPRRPVADSARMEDAHGITLSRRDASGRSEILESGSLNGVGKKARVQIIRTVLEREFPG